MERKVSGGGVTEDYLRSRGRSIEFRRVYDAVAS